MCQLGVLHCSKHISPLQTLRLLFRTHELVWLGAMDLLEHSKPACLVVISAAVNAC